MSCPNCDDATCADCLEDAGPGELIESPSGWTFRASQENGDRVDCANCGNPLDDDYPIVNDADGFAYHVGCHTES
jgi:hypothetical protein